MDVQVIIVAGLYFLVSLSVGFIVARRERNRTEDYFLAGRRLPWYAVALSMTGSNIGTEHFIGMVGTAYAFGIAPAVFEWGNFIPYSILAWIFLPYFFRKKLYTIPEFLERRYGASTRAAFAALSLLHMVLAVLAPALYAGGRILYEMSLLEPLRELNWFYIGCILVISGVTAAYCIYGGLLSVVWTDVLQVGVLVGGGLLLVVLGIARAGGLSEVVESNIAADPGRFVLIHSASHPVSPWPGVFTFWLTLSLWYVGTNQFYIQRCLGARTEWDARMGVIACAFIKFALPLIIVFPGLIAFSLFGRGIQEDSVYVRMINTLLGGWPVGRGIMLAALVAAIMSTVSSVINSASTIWAMDVHHRVLRPQASDEELVRVGRWATFCTIFIGTALAPFLMWWKGGIFLYIQDMAAFLAPPVAVVFLAAFFWRRAHEPAATFTLLFGIASGVGLKVLGRLLGSESDPHWLEPLLNRAAVNWVICAVVMILATWLLPGDLSRSDPDAIWNSRWCRLPEGEQKLNAGYRNIAFWWTLLIVGSVALFVIFE